jgi:hypothetical protein
VPREADTITAGEWAVLGLLAEQPTHGFATAEALAPDGVVGRIWTMRRPLVYRALDVLVVGRCDFEGGPPVLGQTPKARSRAVAERGVRSRGEQRAVRAVNRQDGAVPHRVHAVVRGVEPPDPHPVGDLPSAQPEAD